MTIVVDTNVLVVANGRDCPQANLACIRLCRQQLQNIQQSGGLLLDDTWHIIREYKKEVSQSGQPGLGDAFLRWVLTNQDNPDRCQQIHITQLGENEFAEFPNDPDLAKFDPSDRKFVAVALTHPDCPTILNAVDSDWQQFGATLAHHGIRIQQLCPDCLKG
jgi:hypothetical protein